MQMKTNVKKYPNQIDYESKNLFYVSDSYTNNKKLEKWKCLKCKFIFLASKGFIDKNFVNCLGCKRIDYLKEAQQVAAGKGGTCISKYIHFTTDKISIECSNKHIFKVKYTNLTKLGSWCPECNKSKFISQEICRIYFETLFGERFPSIRPDFLKKENGYNLEIDGFCEKINLGFEHNGTFHYESKFNTEKLLETKFNDSLKNDLCKLYAVNLIVIPQLFNKTPIKKLRKFILDECNKLNINVPYPNADIQIINCYTKNKIDFYKNFAIEKGGKCISEEYLGVETKLQWECNKGHQWFAVPYSIKRGHWCPECGKKKRHKRKS